jgi:hypothetical protein
MTLNPDISTEPGADRSVMQTLLPGDEPPDDADPFYWYEPPTEQELYGLAPDPDCGPPPDAELLGMLTDDSQPDGRPAAEAATTRPQVFAAGFLPREHTGSSSGSGFGSGEVLDTLDAGTGLAGFAADAWSGGLNRLTDDELIGLLASWRRLASWATAGELAAVTELTGRRQDQVSGGADQDLLTYLPDELGTALTLTLRSASRLLDFACGLARLPRTRDALAHGHIDPAKALVIVDELTGLDDAQAAATEAKIIDDAPGQTTGQLRAAVKRAVLRVDPAAADRRRKRAERDARVEAWTECSGTAALAGRDLPPAQVLAADKRIDSLARGLKTAGADGSLDQLRARVYTALLLGQPVESLRPAPAAAEQLAGSTGLAGTVNLTMPLASWLGAAQAPGEVAGFGPVDAETGRTLGAKLAGQPGSRWCLTLTDAAGRAVGHGCARRAPAGSGWALLVRITDLAPSACAHCATPASGHNARGDNIRGEPADRNPDAYRPASRLRHLIEVRHRTCSFRGCRRAAERCDLDHTIPHHLGGATCRCNLAPLCRRHHQAKQAQGWRLDQPQPGVLLWTLPHGRRYWVEPDPYPAS